MNVKRYVNNIECTKKELEHHKITNKEVYRTINEVKERYSFEAGKENYDR